ncbi:hypothetical protein [Nitratidesulfovibrio sp. 1201_IL3209]|uniref:hypothetical protein n=1 Tax=Nitratidesulfovibrio sp. 1201_IL3209 TaxID=3084053 RepID=UPI002FDB547E
MNQSSPTSVAAGTTGPPLSPVTPVPRAGPAPLPLLSRPATVEQAPVKQALVKQALNALRAGRGRTGNSRGVDMV